MYDHIGLKVDDIDASVRFYEAALAPLGHVLCSRDASCADYSPTYYAAFLIDPDGNNLEAVCFN